MTTEATATTEDTSEGASRLLPEVLQSLERIEERLDRRSRADEVREGLFETLHEKLKRQESDIDFVLKKSLLRALASFYDRLSFAEEAARDGGDAPSIVADLKQEYLDLLDREDLVPVGARGAHYDRAVQTPVSTEATEDPALDGTVARVTKEGFLWGERVVRPQSVVVRRHRSAPEAV